MLRLGAPPAATSMALGRRTKAQLEHLARARAARHRTVVNDQLQCEAASTRSAVVQTAAVAEQPPAPMPLAVRARVLVCALMQNARVLCCRSQDFLMLQLTYAVGVATAADPCSNRPWALSQASS